MVIRTVKRHSKVISGDEPTATPEINDDMRLGLRLLAKLARISEQACQSTGISLPQYRLLSEIAAGPRRASALAARLGVSRPTLTSLVNGLEHAGLLVRLPVQTDRRGIELRATDEGLAAASRAEVALAGRLTGLASRTHMADLTALARHMSSVLAQQAASLEKPRRRPRRPAGLKFNLRFPTVG